MILHFDGNVKKGYTESSMSIEHIKKKIRPLMEEYGVTRAGLFGSSARGSARRTSDVDLLVEINKDLSLFGFVAFKIKLEEALGRHVDLVEYRALKPRLRDRILADQVSLL